MRPKKTRWISCLPGERCFKPLCKPLNKLKNICLTLDEFEAIRLADLEGLQQVDAAKKLNISHSTFSRIISSGRNKVADGLVNIKAIKIEGGCCKITRRIKR